MNVWDIVSRDVFASLIKDVSEKSACQGQPEADLDVDEEHGPTILDVLPKEVLQEILQYLTNKDLLSVRLVCLEMKTAASAPQVLKLEVSQYLGVSDLDAEFMQPILPNIVSMTLSAIFELTDTASANDGEKKSPENEEVPGRIFGKLDEQCLNLRRLEICNTIIPSSELMAAHERLIERLTELTLQYATLKSTKFLSATYPRLTKFTINGCTLEGEKPFEGTPEIRMTNLKTLHVTFIENFGDDAFHQLTGGDLPNLEELNLSYVNVTGVGFERLDLTNLKSLYVNQCQLNVEWLSQLKHLRRLQQLCMSNLSFKDANCPRDVFKHCTQLEQLEIETSDIGSRIASAMARYLPNLKRWVLRPQEDGLITDEAFNVLATHTHLEEIIFDRIQLTDVGLRQITLMTPNLKELSLSICTASDETAPLIGQLASLVKLTLHGSRITDAGFAALEPRFGDLLELAIDSRQATVASIQNMIPLLKCIKQLDVRLGDPESELYYYGGDTEDDYSHLRMKNLPSDLTMSIMKRFRGVKSVYLESLGICEQVIDDLRDSQSGVTNFSMSNCEVTEDMVTALAAALVNVKEFSLYQIHMSETIIQRFVEGVTRHGQMQHLYIENEQFPSNVALMALMQMTSACLIFEIRKLNYEMIITFTNQTDYKDVHVDAGMQIDDDIIVEIAKRLPEAGTFTLSGSAVTAQGLVPVGAILTSLTTLTIKSSTLGDDSVAVIGQEFNSLTSLTLECELITDDGLEALGKHVATLTSLTIKKSAITDEGVRRLVPKLLIIAYLFLLGNPKLTRELYDYLMETYPNVQQEAFPEPEDQEQNGDENGEQQQQAEVIEVAADVVGQDANPAPPQRLEPGVPEENHVEDVVVVPQQGDPRPPEVPQALPEENSSN